MIMEGPPSQPQFVVGVTMRVASTQCIVPFAMLEVHREWLSKQGKSLVFLHVRAPPALFEPPNLSRASFALSTLRVNLPITHACAYVVTI